MDQKNEKMRNRKGGGKGSTGLPWGGKLFAEPTEQAVVNKRTEKVKKKKVRGGGTKTIPVAWIRPPMPKWGDY